MIWVGLTGGIGTGKTTVSEYLKNKGFPVVNADIVAHQVVSIGSAGLKNTIQHFGKDFLNPDGSLDRIKMGKLIFNDEKARLKLEQIIHPLVQEKVSDFKKEFEAKGAVLAFYDVPLLFEKNLESNFDLTILISSLIDLQKERIRARNKFSDSEIESRINSQMLMSKKEKKADFVIKNNGSLNDLYLQLDEVVSKILQKAISKAK